MSRPILDVRSPKRRWSYAEISESTGKPLRVVRYRTYRDAIYVEELNYHKSPSGGILALLRRYSSTWTTGQSFIFVEMSWQRD